MTRSKRLISLIMESTSIWDDFNLLKSDPLFKNIWIECVNLLNNNKLISASSDNSNEIVELISDVEANGRFVSKLNSGNYVLYSYKNSKAVIGVTPEGDNIIITSGLNKAWVT